MCDITAELAYTSPKCSLSPPPTHHLSATQASISWNGSLHTNKIRKVFKFAFSNKTLLVHIGRKALWTNNESDLAQWDYIEKALPRTTSSRQHKAHVKFQHELLATNKIRNYGDTTHDHRCTRCGKRHEDWEHIFHCSAIPAQWKTEKLSDLRNEFWKLQLSAPMIDAIFTGTKSWMNNLPARFPDHKNISTDTDSQLIFHAFSDQTNIGWDQPHCGRLATSWFITHDHYFKERHLHNSKRLNSIGPRIISLLWKFGLSFWYLQNGDLCGDTTEESHDYLKSQLKDKSDQHLKTETFYQTHMTSISHSRQKRMNYSKVLLLESQINWIALHETCVSASENPLPESVVPETPQRLHHFFRPFQQFYNKNSNVSL